jgi:aminopeptidase N
LIFYRTNHPDLVNWWWDFRIRRFNPVGVVNDDIYANGTFRTYTNATYFMGAYWLEDLRVRMGDEAFLAALSDYAQSNAHLVASANTFFASLNRHTSVDYSDIMKQYFK